MVGHSTVPSNFQFGLLQLTLHTGSYDFKYITIDGKVLDSGTGVPVNAKQSPMQTGAYISIWVSGSAELSGPRTEDLAMVVTFLRCAT